MFAEHSQCLCGKFTAACRVTEISSSYNEAVVRRQQFIASSMDTGVGGSAPRECEHGIQRLFQQLYACLTKTWASRGWKIPLTQSTPKCKVVSIHNLKACMGSIGLAPCFLNPRSKWRCGQFHAPAVLTLGTNSGPH